MLNSQGLSKIKELIVWSWTYLWALWFLLVIKKLFGIFFPILYYQFHILKLVPNTL
jgi:hypothetical protein